MDQFLLVGILSLVAGVPFYDWKIWKVMQVASLGAVSLLVCAFLAAAYTITGDAHSCALFLKGAALSADALYAFVFGYLVSSAVQVYCFSSQ